MIKDILDRLTYAAFLVICAGAAWLWRTGDSVPLSFGLQGWAVLTLISVCAAPAERAPAMSFSAARFIRLRSQEPQQTE